MPPLQISFGSTLTFYTYVNEKYEIIYCVNTSTDKSNYLIYALPIQIYFILQVKVRKFGLHVF